MGKDDYLRKVRAAADALINERLLLAADVTAVLDRANAHWDYATSHSRPTTTSAAR